jgi:hypothetical protein
MMIGLGMFLLQMAKQPHSYFLNCQGKILLRTVFVFCLLSLLSISVLAEKFNYSKPANNRNKSKVKSLLYLPLDERFTTRDLFLSFTEITSFKAITPGRSMLPQKKKLSDAKELIDWTAKTANQVEAAIISADMLLYGGLIASRISTDSVAEVQVRLKVLEEIRYKNPRLPIFVSTTVMRMPQYSSSDEEPDYYAQYGREIFLYSQHSHRYEVLKNPDDKIAYETYKNKIPKIVLEDYLSRRERNFQINKNLIELVRKNVINRLVITLDDNAEYGLFKKEAAELEKLSTDLRDRIAIYPGADEAQLPLLPRLVLGAKQIPVYIAYRFPEARRLIPSFEGQPLEESVEQQILAAGGTIADNPKKATCILYVNNFSQKHLFAGSQIGMKEEEKVPLENLLAKSAIRIEKGKVYILADNRFYNGADVQLITSIFSSNIKPDQIAYAGWNTSGNTLGTAIAMGFLRYQMNNTKNAREQYKKLLWARFVEDWAYMVEGREELKRDMKQRNITGFSEARLESEYESLIKTLLNSKVSEINVFLHTNYYVDRVFFPWHRHFEIGFEMSKKRGF